MLRYNTSTVLKLNAIARHIEPPGAVIFSSDDLILQLNQTDTKQAQKPNSVSPIKHPKMQKKILTKEFVSDGQRIANPVASETTTQFINREKGENEIIKKAYETPIKGFVYSRPAEQQPQMQQPQIQQPLLQRPQMKEQPETAFENVENVREPITNLPRKINPLQYQIDKNRAEKLFELEQEAAVPEEYELDNYINYEPSVRKIPMRAKYPISRDIRSKSAIAGKLYLL